MNTEKLKQAENVLLFGLLFLLPIVISTSFSNPFVSVKLVILALSLILIFLLKVARNLMTGSKGVIFHTSIFDIPVALLTLSYLLSSFFASPNKFEAFWLPGTTAFILGGALLYFVANQLNDSEKKVAKISLLTSSSLLSFLVVLSGSGALKGLESLPSYIRSEGFATTGSMLSAAIFLAVTFPMVLNFVFKSRDPKIKAASGIASALIGIALVVSFVTIMKNWGDSALPSMSNSWIVATESLKTQPLFGVGSGNYLSAFTRFIPISYNQTAQWSLRFANAHNYYLTAIAETGLLGFASLSVLLFAAYKKLQAGIKERNLFEHLPLLFLLILFAVFPASPVLFVLLFVLLALDSKAHVVHLFAKNSNSIEGMEGKVVNFIIGIPTILAAFLVGFLIFQATKGELIYQKGVNAIAAQDGKRAYDTIRSAIESSPYVDRYHITYAQLNLALANSVAQKKNLTEDEKNTVSQLIQQSIREGRNAVILNPQRATNWEVLGSIYRSVIALAKGADQFALQTYAQAIALDPVNPNTRVALGGIYYSLKRYEEAIDVFKLAVIAKPDNANCHYNLAIAYRDNGQYDKALAELTGTLTLVAKDSKDYDVIKKEIENVQSKTPKKTAPASGDTVKAPETATSNDSLNNKVDLPSDATPPSSETTTQSEKNTIQPSATPTQ